MELGVTTKPLVNDAFWAVDEETLLTKGRVGFTRTKENARQSGRKVKVSRYEEFDLCFPFSMKGAGSGLVSPEAVVKTLMRYCKARAPMTHYELFDDPTTLHSYYDLRDIVMNPTAMTRVELHRLITKTFISWLETVGCDTVVETRGHDSSDVFVLARLREESAETFADRQLYLLQIDRAATPFPEYLSDRNYCPPYDVFERTIEEKHERQGAMKLAGRIWSRYDQLNQPCDGAFDRNDVELSKFRDVDRMRLLMFEVREFWNLHFMLKEGYLASEPFPLHQPALVDYFRSEWASLLCAYTWQQPLDDIRSYFGEEIALYFSFMEFYTKSLFAPAIFGTLLFIYQQIFDNDFTFDNYWVNVFCMSYCVFMALWVSWLEQAWARRENGLRIRWLGQLHDVQKIRSLREQFRNDHWVPHPLAPSRWLPSEKPWKHSTRLVLSLAVVVTVVPICVVLVVPDLSYIVYSHSGILKRVVVTIQNEASLQTFVNYTMAFSFAQRVLLYIKQFSFLLTAILIKVLDTVWTSWFAYPLTDFENHLFEEDYVEAASMKLFVFKFFDYMSTSVFLAFIKPNLFNGDTDAATPNSFSCWRELQLQVGAIFVVGIWEVLQEFTWPLLSMFWRKCKAGRSPRLSVSDVDAAGHEHDALLEAVESQIVKTKYGAASERVADWLDVTMQLALLSLFSMVLPILPLCALIANLLEIRYDAMKILNLHRRPLPDTASSSGFDQNVVKTIGFFSVLCNILLCVFVAGKDMNLKHQLVATLFLLLMTIALRETLQWLIPVENEEMSQTRAKMMVSAFVAIWGDEEDKDRLLEDASTEASFGGVNLTLALSSDSSDSIHYMPMGAASFKSNKSTAATPHVTLDLDLDGEGKSMLTDTFATEDLEQSDIEALSAVSAGKDDEENFVVATASPSKQAAEFERRRHSREMKQKSAAVAAAAQNKKAGKKVRLDLGDGGGGGGGVKKLGALMSKGKHNVKRLFK